MSDQPRQFLTVDDWRLVIDGQPNDAQVGRVHVGDLRLLVHHIDELEATLARHRAGRPTSPHSYAGLRDYVVIDRVRLRDVLPPPAGAT
jgi:hypothetical protein